MIEVAANVDACGRAGRGQSLNVPTDRLQSCAGGDGRRKDKQCLGTAWERSGQRTERNALRESKRVRQHTVGLSTAIKNLALGISAVSPTLSAATKSAAWAYAILSCISNTRGSWRRLRFAFNRWTTRSGARGGRLRLCRSFRSAATRWATNDSNNRSLVNNLTRMYVCALDICKAESLCMSSTTALRSPYSTRIRSGLHHL
jgi:hypothetical protein